MKNKMSKFLIVQIKVEAHFMWQLSSLEMESASWVQFLDEADCASLCAIGKGINLFSNYE